MLNNITNFFNLIVGRRIKTQLESSDLIAVGTKQSPAPGDYKPTAIKFEDLLVQLESLTNTWDMPSTAFVATDGDDFTAVVGDGNKPFSTLTAAANSGAQVVYVLPGIYSTTHALVSGVTYYCAPGVIFNSGTLTALNLSLVDTKWLGHARFEGTFDINLRPQVATRFVFQAETVRVTGAGELFFTATDLSDVYFDLGVLEALPGNTVAPNFSFRGNITGVINIKKAIGYYKVVNLRDIASPQLILNINQLDVVDGGVYGNAGGYKHCLAIEALAAGSVLYINIGLSRNFTKTPLNCGNIYLSNIAANATVKCKIDYAESVANPLIYSFGANADSVTELEVNGYSLNRAFYLNAVGIVNIKNSTFRQNLESLAAAGVECYLTNSTIYSDQNINAVNMNNAASKVYMNGVGTEGNPAAYFITGVAGSTYGLNNVVSNQLLNTTTPTNAYSFVGWNVEPNYKAPKFK